MVGRGSDFTTTERVTIRLNRKILRIHLWDLSRKHAWTLNTALLYHTAVPLHYGCLEPFVTYRPNGFAHLQYRQEEANSGNIYKDYDVYLNSGKQNSPGP
jgi:hypothetical protein